jgi:hypothetical protein
VSLLHAKEIIRSHNISELSDQLAQTTSEVKTAQEYLDIRQTDINATVTDLEAERANIRLLKREVENAKSRERILEQQLRANRVLESTHSKTIKKGEKNLERLKQLISEISSAHHTIAHISNHAPNLIALYDQYEQLKTTNNHSDLCAVFEGLLAGDNVVTSFLGRLCSLDQTSPVPSVLSSSPSEEHTGIINFWDGTQPEGDDLRVSKCFVDLCRFDPLSGQDCRSTSPGYASTSGFSEDESS